MTSLKLSRSRNSTTGCVSGSGDASSRLDPLAEQAAVGEPGQRVVVRLVAQLFLEPRQLGQRLLELAVLECHGRLVGDRLEQAQVLLEEGRALGHSVGDDHRADRARLAAERRDHRLADAGRGTLDVRRDMEERVGLRDHALVERVADRDRESGPSPSVARRRCTCDSRPSASSVRGQEEQLGALGAEHVAGVLEQRHDRRVELR